MTAHGRGLKFYRRKRPHKLSFFIRYQGNTCYLCGSAPFESIDHVIPMSRKRKQVGNVAGACISCNATKKDRKPTACEILFAKSMEEAYCNHHGK